MFGGKSNQKQNGMGPIENRKQERLKGGCGEGKLTSLSVRNAGERTRTEGIEGTEVTPGGETPSKKERKTSLACKDRRRGLKVIG